MKRKSHRTLLASMILGWVLLLGNPAAYAIPDWSFSLLPASGDIAGPAGTTIGWGYTISNPDTANWLSLTGISADPFSSGTPDGSVFDFPVIAPESSVSASYDGVSGLYQLTWDPGAPVGFVNSGTFIATAEWYDGDPFGGGTLLDFAPDRSVAYSATVTSAGPTPVPEPSTWLLLAAGLAGLGALRNVSNILRSVLPLRCLYVTASGHCRKSIRLGHQAIVLGARAILVMVAAGTLNAGTIQEARAADLENGDMFVGGAEGSNSFGLTGPRIIWRVRNGVAERYCEGSAAADSAFFGIPQQMIVDSQGRIVFLAKLGAEIFNQDLGLFRCHGMGLAPERLAVFSRGLGPVTAGFPDPFPDQSFNRVSGLHLATVQAIEINDVHPRLITEDAYVMAMEEFNSVTGAKIETKVRRYRGTTGQWDIAPDAASFNDNDMPVMTNHGGATYSSAQNILRRSTDPLRLDASGSIGPVNFELHAALFGGFKEVRGLIVDDNAVPNHSSGCDPNLPQPPSLLEPGPGLYSVMSSFYYDIAYDGHGNLGLVLRTNSGGVGAPYLTNVSEVLINDNPDDDLGDYFYRSTTGCLPEASLKHTSIVPFFDPLTGASNEISLGSMAVSSQGLVGLAGNPSDRLVRVVEGVGLVNIATGFVSAHGVAVYPAVVPPASGAVVVVRINSPVDVLVTDTSGNRIGVDPATGLPVNDFGQNGFDSGPGEPRFLAIKNPIPGSFAVGTVGTGDGPYSIQIYSGVLGQPETTLNQISAGGTASPGSAAAHGFTLAPDTTIALDTDAAPPVVTPQADITVPATEAGGARGSASAALAGFLVGGSAIDDTDPAPVRLAPQVTGVDADNTMLFPMGTTPVTFRFADASGNVGTAAANVTVAVGTPKLSGKIVAKGREVSGTYFVDLQLTDIGTGHARSVNITKLTLKTLSGSGTVGYMAPGLPLALGNLNMGTSTVIRLYLNVPSTVRKFSVTENGTMQNDVLGTNYNYSIGQAVIP